MLETFRANVLKLSKMLFFRLESRPKAWQDKSLYARGVLGGRGRRSSRKKIDRVRRTIYG